MTWDEFNAAVITFLDVDGTRRGIAAFRTAYIRAALADFVTYLPAYDAGVTAWSGGDAVPFDEEVAEAVAEYVKSKITRNVDRDLQMSQAHMVSYMTIRRRMFARQVDLVTPVLQPFVGKVFVFTLQLRNNKLPLPIIGNVWLTIKMYRGVSDCDSIQLAVGEGIEVVDSETSQIKCTLSAEQTALLSPLNEYKWDVQVETEEQPVFPLNGLLRSRQPITQIYAQTEALLDGSLFTMIGGEPVYFIE